MIIWDSVRPDALRLRWIKKYCQEQSTYLNKKSRVAMIQAWPADLRDEEIYEELTRTFGDQTDHYQQNPLTKPTRIDRPSVFLSFHHICLLTVRAPLRKAVAWPAMTSVLSTNRSILSPLLRICSTFWTMMSFTWFNSFCARVSWSEGGAVLYVCINADIVGPKYPCSPRGGSSCVDDEEGAEMN